MSRREALRGAALLVGGAVFASSGVLAACATREERRPASAPSPADVELLVEIADTLLPATPASPGARAAGVGPLVALWLADCYDGATRTRLMEGLEALRERCRRDTGSAFNGLPREKREEFLRTVEAQRAAAGDPHHLGEIRDLLTRAYFSTEAGITQALRYVRSPGRWDGCVPLRPGQPAWA